MRIHLLRVHKKGEATNGKHYREVTLPTIKKEHVEGKSSVSLHCKHCVFLTSEPLRMRDHMQREHLSWACRVCGHPSKTRQESDSHAVSTHFNKKAKVFECAQCKFGCLLFKGLEKHFDMEHHGKAKN